MRTAKFEIEVLRFRGGRKVRERKTLRIDIPTKVEEITLEAWGRFEVVRDASPDSVQQLANGGSLEGIDPFTYTEIVDQTLKAIYALALNHKDLCKTDLLQLPVSKHSKDNEADTLMAILALIMEPIAKYKPKAREAFTHRGSEYAFYTSYLDQFGTNWVGKDLRTAEAVEALQLEHAFLQRDDKGHLAPQAKYKSSCALLALLTRRVGEGGEIEYPPVSLAERTEWLDSRMAEFRTVPLDVALDLDFFFESSKSSYLRTLFSRLLGARGRRPHR